MGEAAALLRSPPHRRLQYGFGLLNQHLRAIDKHGPQQSAMYRIEKASLTSLKRDRRDRRLTESCARCRRVHDVHWQTKSASGAPGAGGGSNKTPENAPMNSCRCKKRPDCRAFRAMNAHHQAGARSAEHHESRQECWARRQQPVQRGRVAKMLRPVRDLSSVVLAVLKPPNRHGD